MDNTFQSDTDAINTMVRNQMAKNRTSIPGKVIEFDAATQTVTVVPVIRKTITIDQVVTRIDMPPIVKVPLVFPHAQTLGFSVTMPISPGDMVLLVVADRGIDNWAEFGDIQNPIGDSSPRMYDITDSLAIVGATPLTLAVSDYQTNAVEIRNGDRSVRVSVKETEVNIVAGSSDISVKNDGTIIVNATTVTVNGNITVTGGDVTADGISLKTHVHGGVTPGGGITGVPV